MRTPWRLSFLVVGAVTLAACVPAGRFKALERRVVELEAREAERELVVNGTLLRIEAQLAGLAASLGELGELASLHRKVAELEARVASGGGGAIGGLGVRPAPPARRGPDPAQVYAVAVLGAPSRGPADALVTIVRAGEYACPFCERTRDTMDQLVADYGNQVRIVHRDFIVHHATATAAAHAACAAHRQGRFWDMDTLLWERAFKPRQFDPGHLETLAADLGLDLARFRADVAGACPTEIRDGMAELTALGVTGTPAFFINGRFLSGAQPLASFKQLVDDELALAKERIKKGTRKARYYDEWVIRKGLPSLTP
ncbi:MAG: thioredoxin domain-containing protein [Kofleriaceae bacterium]|nr:thioredoxin domain-containing protein [Kofleriaceae bacterium]MCL4224717.1 thioredoxin domain-containing protein [Myxococcales bacterium]